jgi:hypothetical protein
MPVSTGCVAVGDLNNDGHPDLFAGGRVVPGRYPEAPPSHILVNDGKGNFTDLTRSVAPELARIGMVCDALWTDLNQDKQPDLLLAGEWLPVTAFVNHGGKLKNETEAFFGKQFYGFWNRLETSDFNGDGRPDFIIGNLGTNTQIKASDSQPAEMYFADFDQNGSVDPIFCTYIHGKSYPYLTRDELLQQLVSFKKRFTDYQSFATVTLGDLFSKTDLDKAKHLTVNHLETTLFLSDIGGKYAVAPLPAQAQFAPVHALAILDTDQDGNDDLLLCGNDSRLKLRLGKADANYGVLLKGDGKGGFRYIGQRQSGLQVKGDVRSVVQMGDKVFLGINGSKMTAYRLGGK